MELTVHSAKENNSSQTNPQGSQPSKAPRVRFAAEAPAPQNCTSLAEEYINRAHTQPNTKAPSAFRAPGHPKEEKGIRITTKTECSARAEGKGLRDQLVLI